MYIYKQRSTPFFGKISRTPENIYQTSPKKKYGGHLQLQAARSKVLFASRCAPRMVVEVAGVGGSGVEVLDRAQKLMKTRTLEAVAVECAQNMSQLIGF